MKISELWLREWVNPAVTTLELATQLTMAGLEVDAVDPVAGPFTDVVVAKVIQTASHPQADKLTICQVDCGLDKPLQVVCGASNVRPGLFVALAKIGASLPGGILIKETELRGELSQGMLCSVSELGMHENSDGIMELPDDAPIGTDLREYMALNDSVLDIDLTPNRADCFSVLGVAREVATLNKIPLSEPTRPIIQSTLDEKRPIYLDTPEACPLYCGRIIRGINPHATTPLWLAERLRRSGIRVIHPVVDITNYVMLTLGQPMHAFDLTTIEGAIHVRMRQAGESIELLDGQSLTLQEKTLVIADEEKPLAIAGVMGGAVSSVQAHTRDLFLESAFFTPNHLAGVARQYGLCTESSQRFERGVDPTLQATALDMATDLITQIAGGEVGAMVFSTVHECLPHVSPILFNPDQVLRLTGVVVPEADMLATLRGLGMHVDPHVIPWTVTAPSHRFDVSLDVDLVEEIIRVYGYDKIETVSMVAPIRVGVRNALEQTNQHVSSILSHYGYHEIISYSFVDPDIQQALCPDNNAMILLNPISSELSQMRVSLWPGLIASLVYNSHRQQSIIKLFETGVVFDTSEGVLKEQASVAGLMAGELGGLNWSVPTRAFDFYDVKGELESVLGLLSVDNLHFVAATHPGLHPGKSAHVMVGDKVVGWVGVLHPRLAEALDLSMEVMLFEVNLEQLPQKSPRHYQKISKFPSVRRDLSFLIDREVSAGAIERAVRSTVDTLWLKSFAVFDVYAGETIPSDKKSIAMALTLQDDHRTLVDSEIHTLIESIVNRLQHDFSITLRD